MLRSRNFNANENFLIVTIKHSIFFHWLNDIDTLRPIKIHMLLFNIFYLFHCRISHGMNLLTSFIKPLNFTLMGFCSKFKLSAEVFELKSDLVDSRLQLNFMVEFLEATRKQIKPLIIRFEPLSLIQFIAIRVFRLKFLSCCF